MSARSAPTERHFGYGPLDGQGRGFTLFVDPELRRTVFPQLFPTRVSGGLAQRPELQWPAYRYPECRANPFPVAFNDDGTPRAADPACSLTGPDTPARPAVSRWKRFWRGVLDTFGLGPRRRR